jgi:hypothetical protein
MHFVLATQMDQNKVRNKIVTNVKVKVFNSLFSGAAGMKTASL